MRNWSFNRFGGYAPKVDKTSRSDYERRIKVNLDKNKVSYEYETMRIPYTINHYYKPDFVLKNGIIVEAKGLFLPEDRTKHLAIKEQHPHLDIRFLFMKDQRLNKGSKTKYSDWCKKHDYKYAFGDKIPTEWIEERSKKT